MTDHNMALQLIETVRARKSNKKASVYLISRSKYVVRWYDHRGIHMDASDYITNDKRDALNAARSSVAEDDAGSME